MSYIGNTSTTQTYAAAVDYFSGNGSTTAFTLSKPVAATPQVQVVVNNVPQNPTSAFTVSGNTITFTSAPSAGTNNIYVYYTSPVTQVIAPSAGTVQSSSIASGGPTWDANGNVSLYTNASLNAANTFGFKNRIINGAMMIDQRNAGASVTASTTGTVIYTLDRWAYLVDQASKFTIQQNAGSVTPATGFVNYLGVTSSSAYSVLSTDRFVLRQAIEGVNVADLGWGTANAKTVTLSFWVRSSLTGTFGGSLRNLAADRSYPFSYTISAANTWEQKTITIAGDTTGTWLTTTGIGIIVFFGLGVGSTYSSTANAWAAGNYYAPTGSTSVVGTSGATFYITGVQLEKGSVATPFDFRSYGTELQLCQRYFQKLVSNNQSSAGYGNVDTASAFQVTIPTAVQMRTTPTYTDDTGRFRYQGSNIVPTGYTPYSVNSNLVNMLVGTSGASLNYTGTLTVGSNATLSAEL